MDNYFGSGDPWNFTAPSGGVVSGLGYLIGSVVVVATRDGAEATTVPGKRIGEVVVAKVSAQAWTEGLKIYWDNTAHLFTSVVSTNVLVGAAGAVAANPSSTGTVILDGAVR